MNYEELISDMCKRADKSLKQVSREMGKSDNFLSASMHKYKKGASPSVDLLAEIAELTGYKLTLSIGRGQRKKVYEVKPGQVDPVITGTTHFPR